MKMFALIAFCLLNLSAWAIGDEKDNTSNSMGILKGQVVDMITGETITGATVNILSEDKGTFTDFDGGFEFSGLKPGTYTVKVTLLSYQTAVVKNIEVGTPNEDGYLICEIKQL